MGSSRRRWAVGAPPRSVAAVILLFVMGGAPVGARAETTLRSRLALTDDARGEVGAGDQAGAPPRPDPLASVPHPPVNEARPSWQPGATFDAEIGHVNGDLELGLRDRVAERLSRHTLALLDVESGELAASHFVEVGLDLAGHWTAASVAVHGGYRRYAGVSTYVEQVQIEANLTEEASLVAMGAWEIPDGFADTYRAAAILRVFPIDTVLLELGGGTQRVGSAPLNKGEAVYFGAEWQLPFHARTWQLSLFAVREIDALELGGLRISWDMGSTLRDAARQTGWRRVR